MFTFLEFLTSRFPLIISLIAKSKFLLKLANKYAIESYAGFGAPRPRPYSMVHDYTSWTSLTDKSYTGRHLPIDQKNRDFPDIQAIAQLWARQDNHEILSRDTSVLFTYFAQWFTDSFLRTNLDDRRKNNSNHQIDLCQIYGQTAKQTDILRAKKSGKLRHQIIGGEVFPPYLFGEKITSNMLLEAKSDHDVSKLFGKGSQEDIKHGLPSFSELHSFAKLRVMYRKTNTQNLKRAFVTGLEHGNSSIGYTAINTIFLREHNRICDLLIKEYKNLDLDEKSLDDFIFERARNIMIVMLIKIILGDYVRHVASIDFPFQLDPQVGEGKPWKRSNWISVEFDLLYRWHSLVPDELIIDDDKYDAGKFRNNPQLLLEKGIGEVLLGAANQRAGKIGLQNTHSMFFIPLPMVEHDIITKSSIQERTVKMSRDAKLQSYNAYREAFSLQPLKSYSELTNDTKLQQKLESLYGPIDQLEWLVGIYAEKHKRGAMLGELMTRMVAYDAFSHAMSNPLVAPTIFNENTFGKLGMKLIDASGSISDLISRNVTNHSGDEFSFKKS